MMVVGVTGGIATGKSAVVEQFRQLGAAVISADELAREIVRPGEEALAQLVARFGQDILQADGTLDRKALAEIIFADPAARQDLNQITHPAIARLAAARFASLQRQGEALVIYEAPLLFEAGAESRVDRVLVVTAPAEVQRRRLMARDGLDDQAAQARITAQMPLADKVRRADFVVENAGSIDELATQVRELYGRLLMLARNLPETSPETAG
ncbi:dephospho-CoA kinase [Desulfuromonas sp. KJ2020]|uniref:dephospho-CoA kinase n=1 Tax=Desulfuromonas sp. KJ2020 TaxID=2919173 RepID=UPI0020A801A5|nr:dephospho-CoA kinase [Desulfuromonas sp. KJ2020]MCP3176776.1 dephospho-CoA kinase [Desulfuromonas sp. KJ2020]